MNSAIILGSGISERFGADTPKQFIEFNNKKIIEYSINTFLNHKEVSEVIIVVPFKWIDIIKKKYIECKVVEGGATRFQSMLNGYNKISRKSENILIHDAARPLVSKEIIDNCIDYLNSYDAVCPYIDIIDSIISKNNKSITYLNRDEIKKIQTPQGFKKNILESFSNKESYGYDDISTALHYNNHIAVKFFKGEIKNFKITSNIDMHLFKGIVNEM
jgi:2-C-methyl-D-erythritol 4-phosphate cytidylyltransferase